MKKSARRDWRVRGDNESVVVNLTIEAAERVEEVYWIDPVHRQP